ncbi:unnamed protein product [Rotaria sp. Silwood1]|nr:unnamed protein product [Rotaria sp. Silwood1]
MKGVTWFWKANADPWSPSDIEEWVPFTDIVNRQIEQAYQGRQSEVVISAKYKIDLNRLIQVDILDFGKQRPVRRCSKTGDTLAFYRRERFNFAQPIRRSVTDDTLNYGCSFITDCTSDDNRGSKLENVSSQTVKGLINNTMNKDKYKEAHETVEDEDRDDHINTDVLDFTD